MNRGSDVRAEVADTPAGRFNEAPIHESGKCVAEAERSVKTHQLQ